MANMLDKQTGLLTVRDLIVSLQRFEPDMQIRVGAFDDEATVYRSWPSIDDERGIVCIDGRE